jgi:hypothetical protein
MKKLILLAPAIALASISLATPASSAPLAFDCPGGYSCYWTGSGGTGTQWNAPSCGPWTFAGTVWDNNLGSVQNRGGGTVHLYDSADATSNYLGSVVNNGAGVNLGALGAKVSSIRIDC